jgi:hypothetical protein
MNHYIKKCKECQTVIGQCRCPAENKFVEWAVCEKCSAPNRVRDSKARLILTYGGEGYISLDEVEAELDALIAAVRAERVEVTEAMVEAVEQEVGMGAGAWDMVNPRTLCEAVLRVAARGAR